MYKHIGAAVPWIVKVFTRADRNWIPQYDEMNSIMRTVRGIP